MSIFSYDERSNVLMIEKTKNLPIEMNIFKEQKTSYNNYLHCKLQEDVEYFAELLASLYTNENGEITATIKVDDEPTTVGHSYELKRKADKYYQSYLTLNCTGIMQGPFKFLRVPYLDDECLLNCGGKQYVLLQDLRSLEDVTYDTSKKTLNIAMNRANIPLRKTTTGFYSMKFRGQNLPIADIVSAMFLKEGKRVYLYEIIANAKLKRALKLSEFKQAESSKSKLDKLKLFEALESDMYSLGPTRSALNAALNTDSLLEGQRLSRQTGTYPAGTLLTKDICIDLKRQGIYIVYIQDQLNLAGLLLAAGEYIIVDTVDEGTHIGSYLRDYLPQYQGYHIVPKQTTLSTPIIIEEWTKLTDDIVELIYDLGYESIKCATQRGNTPEASNTQEYRFEREVISNGTERLGILVDKVPEGRSYDEWVSYVDNPTFAPTDMNHMRAIDFLAILSMLGYMEISGENKFLDRDQIFLKKIHLIGDTFSFYLRNILKSYVRRDRTSDLKTLVNTMQTFDRDPFLSLTSDWLGAMRKDTLLRPAETVNAVAQYTQANRVIMRVNNARNGVSDKMRLLTISHYGRLDPYETPAGGKLGLLNTRAVGSIVQDNQLLAPYRRVIKKQGIPRLSDKIHYLSTKEEMQYIIGDSLDLVLDDNGNLIENNIIKARVPNKFNSSEPVTIQYVNAYDVQFVNAHTEEHLSPTAMFIPFLCMDDSIRATYAMNMIRQSVYMMHAQVPRVITPFYSEIYNNGSRFVLKAKDDGVICDISANELEVCYGAEQGTFVDAIPDDQRTVYEVEESIVTNDSATLIDYHFKPGDFFHKGDILYDSCIAKDGFFSPGVNALVAYMFFEYNYEDALAVSRDFALATRSYKPQEVPFSVDIKYNLNIVVGPANNFRYVERNGTVTSYDVVSKSDPTRKTKRKISSKDASGIFFRIERKFNTNGYMHGSNSTRDYVAYLLEVNDSKEGDKYAGRHGNKGVAARIFNNSQMPLFNNGVAVDVCAGPAGVPSRMNIGQIPEIHLGFVAFLLDISISSPPFNGATVDDVALLLQYVWDLANKDNWRSVFSDAAYSCIPDVIHRRANDKIDRIREWKGCFNPDGTAPLWNPETGEYYEYPITFGVATYMKLEQEADTKIHARGGLLDPDIEYSQISGQPSQGGHCGGQRAGEMDIHTLMNYGVSEQLHEMLNEASDNINARAYIWGEASGLNMDAIYNSTTGLEMVPKSLDQLRYYFEGVGISFNGDEPEMVPNSQTESPNRKVFNTDMAIYSLRQHQNQMAMEKANQKSTADIIADAKKAIKERKQK